MPDWSLSKEEREVSANEDKVFCPRHVFYCSCKENVSLHQSCSPPHKTQNEQLVFIMQIFSRPHSWWLHNPTQKSRVVKNKSHLTDDLLCLKNVACEWKWGLVWRSAHHSFKANSVQVLGPIVPQNVGSTVRTGRTPVLDLCHLCKQTRFKIKDLAF